MSALQLKASRGLEFLREVDPRHFVLINHALLLGIGLTLSLMLRGPVQITSCILTVVILELIWNRAWRQTWSFNFDRIKSALIIALGLLIILSSRLPWFYAFAGSLAIFGKHLIRNSKKQHIYNPTGLAILLSIAIFPDDVFVRGDQFNGSLIASLVVLVFGGLALLRVRRFHATGAYLVASALVSWALASLSPDAEWKRLFLPEFGTEGLLYMVLMFTDPRTAPEARVRQQAQGFILGALNVFFRWQEFAYSQFVALMLVASFSPLSWFVIEQSGERIREGFNQILRSRSWRGVVVVGALAVLIVPAWRERSNWPLVRYTMFADRRDSENIGLYRIEFTDSEGHALTASREAPRTLLPVLASMWEKRDDVALRSLILQMRRWHRETSGQWAKGYRLYRVTPTETILLREEELP
jgi:hypothetical protein